MRAARGTTRALNFDPDHSATPRTTFGISLGLTDGPCAYCSPGCDCGTEFKCPRTGRPLPEAMVLKETRSNSQIPTPFPRRFPLNSHALTSVEGLLGQEEIDAAIQTRLHPGIGCCAWLSRGSRRSAAIPSTRRTSA